MSEAQPCRGDIWSITFDPTRGREQSGTRPALVVSVDKFNHGPADLAIVLPITSKDKRIPFHVRIDPPEAGLDKVSFIQCEDIRSVSRDRLSRRLGSVAEST